MGCRQYRNALSEAAAGTLAQEQQRSLNEHLSRCAACAEALDRLKRSMAAIDRALLDSAKLEPSPELLPGLERRLRAQTESRWPRISYALLAAAAAGLAVVVAAWTLSGRFTVRSRPAPIAAVAPTAAPASARPATGALAQGFIAKGSRHAATVTRSRERTGQRRVPTEDRRIFEAVKVTPEKEAIGRLYELLQSGQIDPRSLLNPARTETGSMTIAPLHIKPLAIPPIGDDDSNAAPRQSPGTSSDSETDANKEITP